MKRIRLPIWNRVVGSLMFTLMLAIALGRDSSLTKSESAAAAMR
jgi:hypothetical protein